MTDIEKLHILEHEHALCRLSYENSRSPEEQLFWKNRIRVAEKEIAEVQARIKRREAA